MFFKFTHYYSYFLLYQSQILSIAAGSINSAAAKKHSDTAKMKRLAMYSYMIIFTPHTFYFLLTYSWDHANWIKDESRWMITSMYFFPRSFATRAYLYLFIYKQFPTAVFFLLRLQYGYPIRQHLLSFFWDPQKHALLRPYFFETILLASALLTLNGSLPVALLNPP